MLITTRPNILYTLSLISRFMAKPTKIHLQAAKKILRYIKGTFNYRIIYEKGSSYDLIAYTDSDYASDKSSSIKLSKNPALHGRKNILMYGSIS